MSRITKSLKVVGINSRESKKSKKVPLLDLNVKGSCV